MRQMRMYEFKEMCANCIFDGCLQGEISCDGCHCSGYARIEKSSYCKCLSSPSDKEKRCYYYRKNRQCKQ